MAERRMFAKSIVLSDAFLDMPLGARCLYMTMGMMADDDGFVNNAKTIIRITGASEDDLRVLISKKFILPFEDGVIVIKHWRINNYLRNDRYQETKYVENKAKLLVDSNGAYTRNTDGIPSSGIPSIGKDSIGKDSIDKVSIEEDSIDNNPPILPKGNISPLGDKKKKFIPPTLEEVIAYCNERNNGIDPESFIDFYESKGWMVGKNKMKDWKAAIRTWERHDGQKKQSSGSAYINAINNRLNVVDDWLKEAGDD